MTSVLNILFSILFWPAKHNNCAFSYNLSAEVKRILTANEMNRLEPQILKYTDYTLHANIKLYGRKLMSFSIHPIQFSWPQQRTIIEISSHSAKHRTI